MNQPAEAAPAIDLRPFCAQPSDIGGWLHGPFVTAGWLCASDARVLVGVKCDLPDSPSLPPTGLKIAAMLAGAEAAPGPWHPISAVKIEDGDKCDDCDGTGLAPGRKKCPECDGEGVVECDMGHDHDCRECDGEGTVDGEPDPDAGPCSRCDGMKRLPGDCALPWQSRWCLSSRYVRKIALLPDAEIAEPADTAHGIPIRFAGGFGIAMPKIIGRD